MTLAVSQVLQNRYRIVSLLGRGGMGAVYRAWDTRLDVPVALKEMTAQPGLDSHTLDQLRQQFRQEATILARMDHPHLVRVTDFFEESGSVYLVMDFVEGESLADQIEREGSLPEQQVVAWAVQLLDALEYCHGRQVIHRDIKPQNIIICPDGHVELVDFGLVKLWDPNDPQTHTAMRGMGTPAYAPPEQYGAQPGHTDPRSDLYSLGATLYHALTGEPPATAGDRMANPDSFTPMGRLNPRVGVQTETAVMQAMELPLAKRFSSAREMAQALKGKSSALSPERAPARAAPAEVAAPAARRQVPKWAWIAGGMAALIVTLVVLAVALALALGGVGRVAAWFKQPDPSTPEVRTELPNLVSTSGPQVLATSVLLPQSRVTISPESTDQMAELTRLGKGVLERTAYAPDGSLLAVASSLGVYLYDAETMNQVQFFETRAWANDVAFSPDGVLLAIATRDNEIQLRQVSGGALQRTLEGHKSWVASVAFSPDGEMLASGSWDDTVCLWRVPDGQLVRLLEGHAGDVTGVAFTPDGRIVASASDDKMVRLWQVSDGVLLHTLEGHEGYVRGMALSPDGETLASGSDDGTVRLWRVSSGEHLRTFEVESSLGMSWVRDVAFSPDGELLATGAWDKSISLWRVSDGAMAYRLDEHTGSVTGVAFSPDGKVLLSTSGEGAVQLWQASDGKPLHTLAGFTDSVDYIAFSPDGATLASAASYNTVQVWAVDGMDSRVLADDAGDTTGLAFSPDGALLAAASWSEIDFWQVHDGSLLRALKRDQVSGVKSLAFSPDGTVLAVGLLEGVVQLWQVSDKALLHTWQAHADDVVSLAFSPDGSLLATGSTDETARVWRVSDRTQVLELNDYTFWVSSVAFSPDGSLLVTASWDEIGLWRVSDGVPVRVLEGHEGQVQRVSFSPDGELLASASDDGTLRVWRVSDGVLLRLLNAHASEVSDVAFSPDGTLLASASSDGTVRLWGVAE
jgi:WD40 repeat protein